MLMKKLILFFEIVCSSFFTFNCIAQAPNWEWAKSAGGLLNDVTTSLVVDASGNTYMTGNSSSPTFHIGSFNLLNSDTINTYYDLFLAKWDSYGNVVWVKKAKGDYNESANSVAIDVAGNICIVGNTNSPITYFDSIAIQNSNPFYMIYFLVKYDSNGNVLWVRNCSAKNNYTIISLATDASKNVYITGTLNADTVVFDSDTLFRGQSAGFFLVKYDESGNIIWAKNAGGIGGGWLCNNSLAIDNNGNILVTGGFHNPIIFDSIVLTDMDTMGMAPDIFLTKYNPDGKVLWAKGIHGPLFDESYSIAVDSEDNSYITGFFTSSTLSFDSIALINNDTATCKIFIAKYNPDGEVLWARNVGGKGYYNIPKSIAVDRFGNPYITGSFQGDTLTIGNDTLVQTGMSNIFVAKYDSGGNAIWGKSVRGLSANDAYSVALDHSENVYITGGFNSNIEVFDSIILTNYCTGNRDVFLAKLGRNTITGNNELNDPFPISLFPNPATTDLSITLPQKSQIQILNIQGQLIRTISKAEKETTIDIRDLSSGVYIIKAITEDGMAVKKFVKE